MDVFTVHFNAFKKYYENIILRQRTEKFVTIIIYYYNYDYYCYNTIIIIIITMCIVTVIIIHKYQTCSSQCMKNS